MSHHRQYPASSRIRMCIGFTMIEILLVTSLIFLISLTSFQAFASGIKIWQRVNHSLTEEDIFILFDKLTQDLHNAFEFSQIAFNGKSDSLAFATIVPLMPSEQEEATKDKVSYQIGKVEYRLDDKKQLLRNEANYGQSFNKKYGKTRVLAQNISKIRFTYRYRSKESQVMEEKEHSEGGLPEYVSIEIQYGLNKNLKTIKRFIEIPRGGS